MSTVAAGMYLRTLRNAHKLRLEDVAAQAGTSITQLHRIETGEQQTNAALLFALVDTVQGRIEDIYRLLRTPSTVLDAQKLALDCLTEEQQAQAERMVAPERQAATSRAVQKARDNPEQFLHDIDQW